MPRIPLPGLVLGLLLIAADAPADGWTPLEDGPYWVPDWFPTPEAGATDDEISSRLLDLRPEFYGSTRDLPLEIPLLALWLDEADNALADLDFASEHGRGQPPGATLLRGLALAMRAEYGHDALGREHHLKTARDHLRQLDADPELGAAARVNRALVELELGRRQLADSLASDEALAPDLRQRLLHASWEAGLSWSDWRALCDAAIESNDASTLDALMRLEPLRAAAFLHAQLDEALIPAARDSMLARVDFCLTAAPDSIRWSGVEARVARLRDLEGGLSADAGIDRRVAFAKVHGLSLFEALRESQRAESLATEERYAPASVALDRAQAMCDAEYDFYLDYKIQSVRRNVAYNTGDVSTLRTTVEAWETTLARFGAIDPVNDLARGLLETLLGNPREGVRYLTRSYRQSLRRNSLLYRVIALENLAFTYSTLDDDERVTRYTDELLEVKRALEVGELSVPESVRREIEDAVVLGRTLRAVQNAKRHGGPIEAFDTLAEECLRLGAPRSAVEVHLAASRAITNDPAESARHAKVARELARSAGAADLQWKAWALQGRAELALGQVDDARASLDSARTNIDRLRRSAFREDVRARFNIPARFAYSTAIDVAARGLEDAARAYLLDEEGRARALLDRLHGSTIHDVARADDVRATLDATELLVQLRVEPDRVRIWALARESLSYHETPIDETVLTGHVAAWVRSLQDGDPDPRERTLYDLLLASVADELAIHDRLVIVPDGPLRALPFARLEGPRGRLFQTHIISYEISGSVRCRTVDRVRTFTADARPVLMGSGQPVVAGGRAFSRLIDAAGECQDIAAELQDPLLLIDADATVRRFLEASPRASLLHFACHAGFDAGGRAFLQLTPDRGDDRLRGLDIQALDLRHVGMVTLSACETALPQSPGADWSPGDLAGLSASFLAAGVPGVVATLWEIEDADAREVMRGFYRNLRTMDPARALCETQRTIAAPEPSVSGKIRGWGAFCVYGTPQAPQDLSLPRSNQGDTQ